MPYTLCLTAFSDIGLVAFPAHLTTPHLCGESRPTAADLSEFRWSLGEGWRSTPTRPGNSFFFRCTDYLVLGRFLPSWTHAQGVMLTVVLLLCYRDVCGCGVVFWWRDRGEGIRSGEAEWRYPGTRYFVCFPVRYSARQKLTKPRRSNREIHGLVHWSTPRAQSGSA